MTPADIERLIFFIINKTQKRISPSLKDVLQYCIKRAGMKGIPLLEKESWRADSTEIAVELNASSDSPFYGKINISGQQRSEKPIQLNSFVSSLRPLFGNRNFANLQKDRKKELLSVYWKAIERMNKSAFTTENYGKYMILNAMGIYTMHLLFSDYLKICQMKGFDICDESSLEAFVDKMKGFDWSKTSSPISHFGGMSGVREAHRILLNYMLGAET
jgi:hypothetical protein